MPIFLEIDSCMSQYNTSYFAYDSPNAYRNRNFDKLISSVDSRLCALLSGINFNAYSKTLLYKAK